MTALDVIAGDVQRFESCRFDLYVGDSDHLLGQLMVDGAQPASYSNDTTQTLRRQIRDLHVLSRPLVDVDETHIYLGEFDPLRVRVHFFWLLDTPSEGLVEYPLGVFLFADESTKRATAGNSSLPSLVDRCLLLDQAIDRTFGYDAATPISLAMHDVAAAAGVPERLRRIEGTANTFGAPVAWPPGRDTFLAVLEAMCASAGYLPPYFDNEGFLVCRSAPDISIVSPLVDYGPGTVVIEDTTVDSSDQLAAPNRYVVIGGSPDEPIVGIYDVPDDAPNSYARTGRRLRRTIDVQGVTDGFIAAIAAYCSYVGDKTSYSWLNFATPVDPRHDTFDVLGFDGEAHLQTRWEMRCTHGAEQVHTTRRTYQ